MKTKKKVTVKQLEKLFQTDAQTWHYAEVINESPVFNKAIDLAVLTFTDKLAKESIGRESDLMNRGAMHGAEMVRFIMQKTAMMAKNTQQKEMTRTEKLKIM